MADNYKEIHARTIELYERQALEWDRQRSSSTFFERSWIDRFLALLPLGGSVLDVGCGCGYPISNHVLTEGFSVTGVDSSVTLLELCRSRYPDGTWILQDMRRLQLTQKFNGIIAWDSFFHLDSEEQREVLRDLGSLLMPGGILLITVGPEAGEVLGTVGDEKVYHASLDIQEYEYILRMFEIEIVEFVKEDPSCGFHTVLLARKTRTSSCV